jgi:hypothetical protein
MPAVQTGSRDALTSESGAGQPRGHARSRTDHPFRRSTGGHAGDLADAHIGGYGCGRAKT